MTNNNILFAVVELSAFTNKRRIINDTNDTSASVFVKSFKNFLI